MPLWPRPPSVAVSVRATTITRSAIAPLLMNVLEPFRT